VELSQSTWLVAAAVPGIERQPLKKLEPDECEFQGKAARYSDLIAATVPS
jgi:hypothetical protein